jgi:hypothetical protein
MEMNQTEIIKELEKNMDFKLSPVSWRIIYFNSLLFICTVALINGAKAANFNAVPEYCFYAMITEIAVFLVAPLTDYLQYRYNYTIVTWIDSHGKRITGPRYLPKLMIDTPYEKPTKQEKDFYIMKQRSAKAFSEYQEAQKELKR